MGMFAALDQRILTRYTIKAMDLGESAAYLRHHLALAGREEPLFADDALARLHRVSNGLPRALNNAATAALIAAAADGKTIVDDACAKKAVTDYPAPTTAARPGHDPRRSTALVAGLVIKPGTRPPSMSSRQQHGGTSSSPATAPSTPLTSKSR